MFFPEVDPDWQEIQQQFQNVCILRREGRDEAAVQLMEEKLSPLLASWTSSNKEEGAMKRQRLEHLFEEEIKRVDDAWVTKSLLDEGVLKPFLSDLNNTLAEIKAATAAQRSDASCAPQASLDDAATPKDPSFTVDFEVALEPIRMELAELKQSITALQPRASTPPTAVTEKTLRSIVEDCQAANHSREEILIAAYAAMRDEIASLKQQLEASHIQTQIIEEISALKAQISRLAEHVQAPIPKPDYAPLLQGIDHALKQAITDNTDHFAQQITGIADTLNEKEDAVTESVEQNQAKHEYMHRQLLDALESIYQEHRAESAVALKDEFTALAAQDRDILHQANATQRDWILRVGKTLRTEIKEIRKQIQASSGTQPPQPHNNSTNPSDIRNPQSNIQMPKP